MRFLHWFGISSLPDPSSLTLHSPSFDRCFRSFNQTLTPITAKLRDVAGGEADDASCAPLTLYVVTRYFCSAIARFIGAPASLENAVLVQ
jgi:hypothetical protein